MMALPGVFDIDFTVAVVVIEGLVELEGQGEGEREGLVHAVEVPEREGETLAD